MNKEKFEALLPFIVTALIQKIVNYKSVSQDKAFSLLYSSDLYKVLENEKNKVWYYSAEKLFQLLEEEITTGKMILPEY